MLKFEKKMIWDNQCSEQRYAVIYNHPGLVSMVIYMVSCLNIFTISLSCQKQLEQGTYEICDCMYWSILIAPAYTSENTVQL